MKMMEQDSNVNLKWDAHQDTLKSVFDTLLDTESLADCTICAEDQHLKAHKIMLSACSRYFERLFSNHCKKHVIIVLPGVKFPVLKALVEFMYRGEVLVSQDKIDDLLQLADFLQVKGLSYGENMVTEKKPADTIGNSLPSSHCSASPKSYEHCDSPEVLEVSCSSSQTESFHKDDYTKVSPTSTPARKHKKGNLNSSRGEPLSQQDVVDTPHTVSHNVSLERSEVLDKRELGHSMFSDIESRPSLESQLPVFSEGNLRELTLSRRDFISEKSQNNVVRKSECPTVIGDSTNLETFAEPKQENCSLGDVIIDNNENQHENVCEDISFVSSELTESSFCDGESLTQQMQFQQTEWTSTYSEQTSLSVAQIDPTEQTSASNIRFKCESCNRSYRYYRDLRRHLRYECGKEPQFRCPHCPIRFKHKHQLKVHMHAVHKIRKR